MRSRKSSSSQRGTRNEPTLLGLKGNAGAVDPTDMGDAEIPRGKEAPRCALCGSAQVPVVYGFPGDELARQAAEGTVVIGGCIPISEEWACPHHGIAERSPERVTDELVAEDTREG